MITPLKIRGFEVIKDLQEEAVQLPVRATEDSAGYDFFALKDYTLNEGDIVLVETGVKAYMRYDEVLILANRSSNPRKGLELANSLGIIDADYYENLSNDGHIQFLFKATKTCTISKGDRIGQGVFTNYLIADNGNTNNKRVGGFGSTGEV